MSALERLHNWITLNGVPFTERGARLLLFREENKLAVRLAERWVKWENKVGHYRKRPPFIENFTFCDEQGTPLDITADTYPHRVDITTAVGVFVWTFMDTETLLVKLPAGRFGLNFIVRVDKGMTDWRGGVMRGVRSLAYTTSATILENAVSQSEGEFMAVRLMLEASEGDCLMLNITPRLGFNRSIPDANAVLEASRARWQSWFDAVPQVKDEYRAHYEYAWWVMRAGLLSQRFYFTREAMTPSKVHYVGVRHWDQFFHAIAYRHIDAKLAEDQIRIVLDHQREDGMLPDAIHDEGLVTHLTLPVDEDVTKPPLGAWAALKLYETSGHLDFLKEVWDALTRWHRWWWDYSSDGHGLCEYRHPFSSGLDDSPLWDYGMPVTAPDLNTYLYRQMESLATIADLIGKPQAAAQYRADAVDVARRVHERLWNAEKGVFMALQRGVPVPVLSLFNLMPVWMNQSPPDVVDAVLAHLTNPDEFWTPYPLPTVALSDRAFDPLQMWRGPSWMNSNYLFIEMLTRLGQDALAVDLRRKTLNVMMQHRDIYEYYHPLTAERPPKAAPMFGWSASVFIDLAIQESR